MKLNIYVHPRSSKDEVKQLSEDSYKVRLTAEPVDGEANEALIELLAEHFDVPKTNIEIVQGFKNKRKVVEIKES